MYNMIDHIQVFSQSVKELVAAQPDAEERGEGSMKK